MAAPTVKDFLFWVIVLKIMPWNFNGKIFVYISKIFVGQGFLVVFRMTGNKKLAARFAGDQIGAGFLRRCQKRQLRAGKNVLVADCCMAGMGGKEKFVKTAHQRMLWLQAFDVQTRRTSFAAKDIWESHNDDRAPPGRPNRCEM